jgi:ADP-heptose:LPS heptosyltransferase
VPGLRLCSLQKGHGLDALRAGALGAPCLDLDAELDPGPDAFIDTLDLMGALDVIITSDTATAHLAGGAGLPAHLLLSRPADWRWGQDGERSPWYPSLRLWRQPRPGAWGPLLERLAAALA